ncbi:hypothetical protein OAN96_00970 [Candidatus Gracilibacteria bacterium]|nr:hypothetical protein [Candidatus Gracilibacteria bacterium]
MIPSRIDHDTGKEIWEVYSGIILVYKWGITEYGILLGLQALIVSLLIRNVRSIK